MSPRTRDINRLSAFPRERGDTCGAFAFKGLRVNFSLTGDDEIARRDGFLQPQHLRNKVKAGADFRIAKTHQTEAETAGGTCAGLVAVIDL